MKKKILIITNSDVGLYKFRRNLILKLLENYEVTAAMPAGQYTAWFQEQGVTFQKLELERHGLNPFTELRLLRRYDRLVQAEAPAALLTYTVKPNIYGGLAARRHGVWQLANITGLGSALEKPGLLQRLLVRMYKYAFRRDTTVFFQNQANRDFFRERQIPRQAEVLLPGSGVDLDHFRYRDYPVAAPPEFLFEGRIMKEKGIEEFLRAAEVITERCPGTRFSILGVYEEETYRPRIEALERRGVVRMLGPQTDVRPFLARCGGVIHPSYYAEGMSNVLLEAAASGRPVFTTARSGCRETVADGVTGFIVRERDADHLIASLERFLAWPPERRAEMGRAGRQKMEREFDRRRVVARYLETLAAGLEEPSADRGSKEREAWKRTESISRRRI